MVDAENEMAAPGLEGVKVATAVGELGTVVEDQFPGAFQLALVAVLIHVWPWAAGDFRA